MKRIMFYPLRYRDNIVPPPDQSQHHHGNVLRWWLSAGVQPEGNDNRV